MSDPLASEFDVTVDRETFTFRKPGIYFQIEIGYRAADVRRRAAPATNGVLPNDFGIDRTAAEFARCCALLELYLVRSDQAWVFSPGADGKPVVDSSKFPADREDTVWQVATAFEDEVARFRKRRNPGQPPAGAETVGGQPNPG